VRGDLQFLVCCRLTLTCQVTISGDSEDQLGSGWHQQDDGEGQRSENQAKQDSALLRHVPVGRLATSDEGKNDPDDSSDDYYAHVPVPS
jgi:hypothetical protein